MRKTSGMKSVAFIYGIFVAVLAIAVLAAAIYAVSVITVTRPEGRISRSDWPRHYAENFARYISVQNGKPKISTSFMNPCLTERYWSWMIWR